MESPVFEVDFVIEIYFTTELTQESAQQLSTKIIEVEVSQTALTIEDES